ncbi:MAG: MFS transporter [Firmicutes bacterium]|nr:MFS transporter [Bacillota bacterium]
MIIMSEYAMLNYHSPPGEAGLAASIFIIGALAARFFSGNMVMRFGYKRSLYTGVFAGLVMSLAYFEVNSILLLLPIRFLHGITFGITSTATSTIVADLIPHERRGEGIAYFSLSSIIATAMGPFIGMFLSRNNSYNPVFTAAVIVLIISLSTAPFLSLRKTAFPEEAHREGRGFKLRNCFEPRVIPVAFICLLGFLAYSSIVSFLTVYAQEIKLVAAAGYYFIFYAVAVIVSRPLVGRLLDLKGENVIVYPAIVFFGAAMLLHGHSYHGAVLLAAAVLAGLGFGAIQASTHTIAVKITPRHRMGLANSTYLMFYDIGMGIGPIIAGLLIPLLGYRWMYTLMGLIVLSGYIFYYYLHGKKASLHKPEKGEKGYAADSGMGN